MYGEKFIKKIIHRKKQYIVDKSVDILDMLWTACFIFVNLFFLNKFGVFFCLTNKGMLIIIRNAIQWKVCPDKEVYIL